MAEIKDLVRMCKSYKDCAKCPLAEMAFCPIPDSKEMVMKLDEVVENWANGNPRKTYMQDFFEKFPNAPRRSNGGPRACLANLYCVNIQNCDSCIDCWSKELED